MNDFWNNYKDDDLSPLELAEKKWTLENEALLKLEKYCTNKSGCGKYDDSGLLVEWHSNEFLLELRKKVVLLHGEYLKLRKEKKAKTEQEEKENLNLKKFKELPRLLPFEELLTEVQLEIDSCKYRKKPIEVFTYKYDPNAVEKMLNVLSNNGFQTSQRFGSMSSITFTYSL